MTLPPGGIRHLTLQAVECRCARCLEVWVSVSKDPAAPPKIPKVCARCKSKAWRYPLDESKPGKRRSPR
jgi:hypothetical protein